MQEGYKYMFDEQLVTVWSAPNYCYRCGNMASILTVRDDGSRAFTTYGAAPENENDKGQKNRKMVRPRPLPALVRRVCADGHGPGYDAVLCIIYAGVLCPLTVRRASYMHLSAFLGSPTSPELDMPPAASARALLRTRTPPARWSSSSPSAYSQTCTFGAMSRS